MNALLGASVFLQGFAWSAIDTVMTFAAGRLFGAAEDWNPQPQLPSGVLAPIDMLFSWGRGIIAVIGVIGVLYCAGKMAVGKGGRADLAADGVGGLVWIIMGISLMLVAVSVVMMLLSPPGSDGGVIFV